MGTPTLAFSMQALIDFHQTHKQMQRSAQFRYTGKDYGNVELEENQRIISFQEKPKDSDGQFINAGVYCLQKDLIQRQRVGSASLETDWFPHWLLNERVFGMAHLNQFTILAHLSVLILQNKYLKKDMLISIVFSFRNEAENLKELIDRVTNALSEVKDLSYELIFVNDNSDDESLSILLEKKKKISNWE